MSSICIVVYYTDHEHILESAAIAVYSIKAVSRATGLTVETLRAWERRHAVVVPQRDETGRRVYRPQDVTRLRQLKEATNRGHPISRLAPLGEAQLDALLRDPHPNDAESGFTPLVARILEAAGRFQVSECEQPIALATALLPPSRLISEVLQPLLRDVGLRWHEGELSIAQERLVSGAVRRNLSKALEIHDRAARGSSVVFATLPGERHELGLMMCAMLCASRGCTVHYLGPDVPVDELARYARAVSASVIALSVILDEPAVPVPDQLRELAEALLPGMTIWLGGSGTSQLTPKALPRACIVIPDQLDLERRLDLMRAA